MSHGSGVVVTCGLLPLLVRRYPLPHSSGVGGAAVGIDMTAGMALGAAAMGGVVVATEVVACGVATDVVSSASMSSSRSFIRVTVSWRIASMNAMKR